MPPFLDIRERRARGEVLFSLRGELDAESGADLVCRLSRHVHSGASVVLDLRGLVFVDPAGVETLRRVAAWADADGWTLAITGAPPEARRVFRLTSADAVLPLR